MGAPTFRRTTAGSAGAGGFLFFYAVDPGRLRRAMADAGLPEVRFGFDFDGGVVLGRS